MQFSELFFCVCGLFIAYSVAAERNGTRLAFRVERANRSEFPHQVSIQIFGYHHCGGALISRVHILTAAHCVNEVIAQPHKAEHVTVEVGSATIGQGRSYAVKRLSYYKNYDGNRYGRFAHPRDIAVITLRDHVKLSERVRIINLPSADFEVPVGQQVTISGWGNEFMNGPGSPVLRKSVMYVVSHRECNWYYQYAMRKTVVNAQICCKAGYGYGTCQGDSGSPLIYDDMVVGVVSSGDGHCGAGNPDLYTKVSSFISYIQYEMNYDFDEPESYYSPAIALNLDDSRSSRFSKNEEFIYYPWDYHHHYYYYRGLGKRYYL